MGLEVWSTSLMSTPANPVAEQVVEPRLIMVMSILPEAASGAASLARSSVLQNLNRTELQAARRDCIVLSRQHRGLLNVAPRAVSGAAGSGGAPTARSFSIVAEQSRPSRQEPHR